jgi:ATP-dependent Clp protease ATP-binding subunit ClpC
MAVAHQFASEQRAREIEPEHILRAIASVDRGVGRTILDSLGVDLFLLLPRIVELLPTHDHEYCIDIEFGVRGNELLSVAWQIASSLSHEYVGTEHLTLALLRVNGQASDFLRHRGATYEAALDAVTRLLTGEG